MGTAWTEDVQNWISSVMFSRWFFPAVIGVGLFFAAILIWGLIHLFRKNEISPSHESDESGQEFKLDCSRIAAAMAKPNGKPRQLLLAAGSLHDLPVTIPVNMAIHLAASYKCLLIDLDTKRDALAHVFEINLNDHPTSLSPVPTPLANLHIWPAHFFSRIRQMDLKTLLVSSRQKYDVILLNAPTLTTHPDRGRIVRCAESAVIFAKDKKNAEQLLKLAQTGSCRILQTLTPEGRHLA